MKVQCPNCKAVYNIDDSKVPEKGVKASCPKCKTRFTLKKLTNVESGDEQQLTIITCPKCGHVNLTTDKCVQCGAIFSDEEKNKLGIKI